jgi:hypothetical protein
MKALFCEREFAVARAARSGFWSSDLRRHAEACPVCAETLAITTLLLEDSVCMGAAQPPEPAHAWLEARRRVCLHLRHRALFWFRALRLVALLYLPAILVWTLSHHAPSVHEAWKPSFRVDLTSLVLTGPAEIFTLSGALFAAFCVFMGTWYLLREVRTPLHHSPSR